VGQGSFGFFHLAAHAQAILFLEQGRYVPSLALQIAATFEPDHLPFLMASAVQEPDEFGEKAKAAGLLPGLLSGLVFAGADTVISSLWSVFDDSTAVLIGHFYQNMLQKGMSKSDARPSTWGPFVLSGNWN